MIVQAGGKAGHVLHGFADYTVRRETPAWTAIRPALSSVTSRIVHLESSSGRRRPRAGFSSSAFCTAPLFTSSRGMPPGHGQIVYIYITFQIGASAFRV